MIRNNLDAKLTRIIVPCKANNLDVKLAQEFSNMKKIGARKNFLQ